MLPTIYDEIAWDRFLNKICAGCKTVEKNNGICPHEGQEGDCKIVAKKLEKMNDNKNEKTHYPEGEKMKTIWYQVMVLEKEEPYFLKVMEDLMFVYYKDFEAIYYVKGFGEVG